MSRQLAVGASLALVMSGLAPVSARAPAAQSSVAAMDPAPAGARDDANEGRRDPFVSLLLRKAGSTGAETNRSGGGLAATAISNVVVTGITQSGSLMLAILESAGRQAFVARVNDRLLDGFVESIDRFGVVLVQDVAAGDPVRVRKLLKRDEEGSH